MYKTSKVVNWQMLQNSRKPGFQFLLIRSGINMSALCLPASCCRSQIFLQYFNSHFLETSAASYLEIFWFKKYQFSNYNSDCFQSDFLFLFDNLSKWVFSPGSLCLTAGKRQRRRRRKKRRRGGRLTQNTTLPHYSRPLGQLPPQHKFCHLHFR